MTDRLMFKCAPLCPGEPAPGARCWPDAATTTSHVHDDGSKVITYICVRCRMPWQKTITAGALVRQLLLSEKHYRLIERDRDRLREHVGVLEDENQRLLAEIDDLTNDRVVVPLIGEAS